MTKSGRVAGGARKIGRTLGGALGGKASKAARKQAENPVIGAVIGAATVFVAKKVLPGRIAAIGATIAAGYVTRKLAQRTERMQVREERTERMQVREGDPDITPVSATPVKAGRAPSSARASRRR